MSSAPTKISFSRRSEGSIGASGTGGVYHDNAPSAPRVRQNGGGFHDPPPRSGPSAIPPRPESVEEPGSSEGPVAVSAPPADPERESGLAQGQPGEQAELD